MRKSTGLQSENPVQVSPLLPNHIIVVTLREDVVSLTSLHVKDLSYADVPIVYLLKYHEVINYQFFSKF